jgi:hypothetical protein
LEAARDRRGRTRSYKVAIPLVLLGFGRQPAQNGHQRLQNVEEMRGIGETLYSCAEP